MTETEQRMCIYTLQLVFPLAHAHERFMTPTSVTHANYTQLTTVHAPCRQPKHLLRECGGHPASQRWRGLVRGGKRRASDRRRRVCIHSTLRMVARRKTGSIGRHLPKMFTRDEVRVWNARTPCCPRRIKHRQDRRPRPLPVPRFRE